MRAVLKVLQFFSITLAVLIVAAFVLAVLGRFPWNAFWVLAALLALVAYVILPRIRKKFSA